MSLILETNLNERLLFRGKVRDIYDLGDRLLIVATDRISAFDVVLPTGIPDKGRILTQISVFWFDYTSNIVENHLINSDIDEFPENLKSYRDVLEKRSIVVKKAERIPLECVVRGYLSGSGWKEYNEKKGVCGIELRDGLLESQKLDEPIFTPATKEDVEHDINITEEEGKNIVGSKIFEELKEKSIEIYKEATEYAEGRGVIIADTKFEFGIVSGKIILIDEILTPDSSRFWDASNYKAGTHQVSFDKQFVRDWLESLDWNKRAPAPHLPEEIVKKTREKYFEAFKKITGRDEI